MAVGFIAYYRVSTAAQGRSGLGLEAQQAAVLAHVAGGRILAEHVEVESGRNPTRPALERALADARLHRAPLIVAKVDRLTRSVAFLSRLLESGVDVRFCDLPQLEGPTGRFMLTQLAAVAELEAGLISARTKAALTAAKARGKRLGGNRGYAVTADAGAAGRAAGRARADAHAAQLAPVIAAIRAAGTTSQGGIAAALNARGIPAPRGGSWRDVQVRRVLERLSAAS